jgi:RNA polymerase sigma-70 factor (ECF subfamily)
MDLSLFDRVKKNDASAFNEIYKIYYRKLCYIAFHVLNDSSSAEEVADDVMCYLWNHRSDINDISIESYLVRAVRHRSLNIIHTSTYQNEKFAKSISHDEDSFFLSLFTDSDPLQKLLSEEMYSKINSAIETLPEQTKRVFMMSRFENKKYQQIADELGIVVPTVKYHMSNATKLLMQSLEKYLILIILIKL